MTKPTFADTDLCARCSFPRSEHSPDKTYMTGHSGYSNGGAYIHTLPTLAVTCLAGKTILCGGCLAFIEPDEPVPLLTEKLPARSREFFDYRWSEIHGSNSKLEKPWFARTERETCPTPPKTQAATQGPKPADSAPSLW